MDRITHTATVPTPGKLEYDRTWYKWASGATTYTDRKSRGNLSYEDMASLPYVIAGTPPAGLVWKENPHIDYAKLDAQCRARADEAMREAASRPDDGGRSIEHRLFMSSYTAGVLAVAAAKRSG